MSERYFTIRARNEVLVVAVKEPRAHDDQTDGWVVGRSDDYGHARLMAHVLNDNAAKGGSSHREIPSGEFGLG